MEAGRPRSKRGVSRQIAPKVTTLFSLSVSNTIWHVSQTVVRFTGTYAISAVALMAKFQLREAISRGVRAPQASPRNVE